MRLVVLSALLLLASPARADDDSWRFSLSVQFALFAPPDAAIVTSEGQSLGHLYGDAPRVLPRLELGFGRETVSGFWAFTTAVGYWRANGTATDLAATTNPTDAAIALTLVPISLGVFWRGDLLMTRFGVPFVPYVRLGVGFVSWNSGRQSGSGLQESGWAYGLEYGGGIQLLLEGLDTQFAAIAEQESGLRSTALFAGFRGQTWSTTGGLSFASNGVELGLTVMF